MPAVHCDPQRKRTHRAAILSELREQQELAMADMRNPETKPHVRAMLMKSYVEVQRQRNVERMRPAPKPIDVAPKRKRSAGPSVVHMPIATDPTPGAQSSQ